MKALYVYNPWSAAEVALIVRAEEEMGSVIECVPYNQMPDLLRYLVRATPALIIAEDHLQGEHLINDVDGSLAATIALRERMQKDDLLIHGQEVDRIADLIHLERHKAVEEYKQEIKEALASGDPTASLNL